MQAWGPGCARLVLHRDQQSEQHEYVLSGQTHDQMNGRGKGGDEQEQGGGGGAGGSSGRPGGGEGGGRGGGKCDREERRTKKGCENELVTRWVLGALSHGDPLSNCMEGA